MWSWHGLNRDSDYPLVPLDSMTSEALYDPLAAQKFNIYYSFGGSTPQVLTTTIPINTAYDDLASKSAELPTPRQNRALTQCHAKSPFCQKGLYFSKNCESYGIHLLVIPLKDIASRGPEKALQTFVSYADFVRPGWQTIEVDMDEATGRVVMWVWDNVGQELKIFVGDFV